MYPYHYARTDLLRCSIEQSRPSPSVSTEGPGAAGGEAGGAIGGLW
jgi:hypothetical protein